MQIRVLFVQDHGRVHLVADIRRLEDLGLLADSCEHELAIRREGECSHRAFEVKVSDDDALLEVDDERKAVDVDSD